MTKVDHDKALALMGRMKKDIFKALQEYTDEAALIAVNTDDPNIPVIAFAQMALANAAVDFLKFRGASTQECFQVTVNVTGKAMQEWINAVLRKHGVNPGEGTDAGPITIDNEPGGKVPPTAM